MVIAMKPAQTGTQAAAQQGQENSKDALAIQYYELDILEYDQVIALVQKAVDSIDKRLSEKADEMLKQKGGFDAANHAFLRLVFGSPELCDFLITISRVDVFSHKFAENLSMDLELLANLKKMKYSLNLPLGQLVGLLNELMSKFASSKSSSDMTRQRSGGSNNSGEAGSQSGGSMVSGSSLNEFENAQEILMRDKRSGLLYKLFKDFVFSEGKEGEKLIGGECFDDKIRQRYLDNAEALEKIDPHAVYPTSIYRRCDGLTLATQDAQTIEATMETALTTTIKICSNILNPAKSSILADVYAPLGRCLTIIDDKCDTLGYSEQLKKYFAYHGIDFIKMVFGGNEVDKDMSNVEQILVSLKRTGACRNEPVLIVGGGVIADIAGFACALYHRNTPYVMLCTSIVSGIDAGPSPRTCCDGFGYKNLYGAYHPPVLTLTDRSFWGSLKSGWVRHGIAEIIKMAVVKDLELFEELEQAGHKLVRTQFGSSNKDEDPEEDAKFQELCDSIVGKAMLGYVRSEYGNLWETHQCRPHAYGHTWSPGYELPAGMLHGHAVATCMGFGAYLACKKKGWISETDMVRIMKLINVMELSLWHSIMDDVDTIYSSQVKMTEKRGGNLCAPVPRGKIGETGYINDMSKEELSWRLADYKKLCQSGQFERQGLGVEVHCADVGLQDPSTVIKPVDKVQAAFDKVDNMYCMEAIPDIDADIVRGLTAENLNNLNKKTSKNAQAATEAWAADQAVEVEVQKSEKAKVKTTYQDWIKTVQIDRNANIARKSCYAEEDVADMEKPPKYDEVSLFAGGTVEDYAAKMTTPSCDGIKNAAKLTEESNMFMPCMVGSMEAQFLKMMCQISNAKKVLDVGTYTGMSALAFAEGLSAGSKMNPGSKVVTLEFDPDTAKVAQKAFTDAGYSKSAIDLRVGDAAESMRKLQESGEKFDIIFLDADKENYVKYYAMALDAVAPLLAPNGLLMADNTLCALVYDEEDDRRLKLHHFNQIVKNDPRVEQVCLTVREGITMVRRKADFKLTAHASQVSLSTMTGTAMDTVSCSSYNGSRTISRV